MVTGQAVIVYFEALRLFNGGLQLCVCGGGGGELHVLGTE
jgi:hypothetical protein